MIGKPAGSPLKSTIQTALERQRSGDRAGAEALYREVLAVEPGNADCLHLLGVLMAERKDYPRAVELIEKAIALNGQVAAFHNNLGNALQNLGRISEAMVAYRRAIELAPGYAGAHSNLGNALRAAGRLEEAVACYRRACELDPSFPAAWNNLGIALTEQGEALDAISCFQRALELKPGYREAYNNLGNAYQEQGDLSQAIASYEQALAIDPEDPGAQNNLAIVLQEQGRLEEAIQLYRQALVSQPDYPEALNNLGTAFFEQHRLEEALACYRSALRLRPDYPEAEANLSHALLMQGRMAEGWEHYEKRWEGSKDAKGAKRAIACPQWRGEDLAGRTILLHAEQGLGDAIQFVRYVPRVAQRGGRVILECHGPLVRLFRSVPGVTTLIARGEPVPTSDLHCPLLSLPLAFGTTLETIPAQVPYLTPDPAALETWRGRLAGDGRIKVGLAWRGEPRNRSDHKRSLALALLAPLAGIEGVRYVSLQKAAEEEAKNPPAGLELIDYTRELADFADTAALAANLDLVISVDTSVVHLAGALGKPVWLLCRYESEWRWMLEREDSPWYPTMRLFRQRSPGDWPEVIARVAAALRAFARTRDETDPGRLREAALELYRDGEAWQAEELLKRAAAARPEEAGLWNDLGAVRAALGKEEEALACYRRALVLNADLVPAHTNLGDALKRRGDKEGALACYARAAELNPQDASVLTRLAEALLQAGAVDEAWEWARRAFALAPGSVEACLTLGTVLRVQGRTEKAVEAYRRAVDSDSQHSLPYYNLGNAFQDLGRLDEAITAYRRAIELKPDEARYHWNYAHALLMKGEYALGWREYEWRWALPELKRWRRPFYQAQWKGEDLKGRTVLLHAEQGFGDTIQFVRYGPLVAQRGGRVILECPRELKRLFESIAGIEAVVIQGEPLPAFGLHCPLPSLPLAFGTTLDTVPADLPYLAPDPEAAVAWEQRLAKDGRFTVGLVWAGGETYAEKCLRDIPLALFAPLGRVQGTRYVSLQKGEAAQEAKRPPDGLELEDYGEELADFADTAALIANLDLVIAVDTAVAHLAGALGKPVWLLCRYESEWRWGLDREDSPWYPTMRIFRQPRPGDWNAVMEKVARQLVAVLSGQPPSAGQEITRKALERYQAGAVAEAKALLEEVVAANPHAWDAWNNLGVVLHSAGKAKEAVAAHQRALAWNPRAASAYSNLGTLWQEQGRIAEAIACYRNAIAFKPDHAPAHNNLGLAFALRDRAEKAIACFERALSLNPNYAEAHYNLGNAYKELGQWDQAARAYRRALALKPDYAVAHWNLALALLFQGRFEEGWEEYEWRWQCREFAHLRHEPGRPRWEGDALAGSRILLYAEQGYGDAIQFVRYAPRVASRGARVILECPPELKRLFGSVAGVEAVVAWGEPLPEFDLQCPLLSLPRVFRTALATLPASIPYLQPEPEQVRRWQERLAPDSFSRGLAWDGRLRVGLAWAGDPRHPADRKRSLPLALLAPLMEVEGVRFVSLQKGEAAREAKQTLPGLVDHTAELADFADTAALIANLDLVIAVDTAVAHLAGALGKPVWLLCRYESEWRWGLDREDSPWYPTMRIFRQLAAGNWQEVIARVAAALERMKSAPRSILTPASRERKVFAERMNVFRKAQAMEQSRPRFNDLKPCRWGLMLYNRNDRYVGRSLALYGEYSEYEVELFKQIVRPGDVVVEAGANIGAHTLFFAQAVGTQGAVYAFEPQRIVFQTLCANLALNDIANVIARPSALGKAEGNIAVPVLDPTRPANFGGLPLASGSQGEAVPVETVDGLGLSRCRLIKADVEGMETQVLEGARDTIQRLRPILYVENDRQEKSADLIRLIQGMGYRLWWHLPPLYHPGNFAGNPENVFGNTVSVNLLCLSREARVEVPLREVSGPEDTWRRTPPPSQPSP